MLEPTLILQMEEQGLLTRTFRRLDPQRQESIVRAIIEEATEKGPSAINIKLVAKKAAVSIGSLYQYFGGRNNLLRFATEMVTRMVTVSFDEYRPYLASIPLEQGISEYLLGGIEWSREYADFLRLFARAAYIGNEDQQETLVRPVANSMRQVIAEMLEQAAARGELRPNLDLEVLEHILHALTIALGDPILLPYLNTYFQVTSDTIPPERAVRCAIDMVMNGIGASSTEKRESFVQKGKSL